MHITELARALKGARKGNKLSQAKVGKLLGKSASEVSRLETGERGLPFELVQPWAEAVGLRAEIVLFREHESVEEAMAFSGAKLNLKDLRLLRALVHALPHLPEPRREALLAEMEIWTKHGSSA